MGLLVTEKDNFKVTTFYTEKENGDILVLEEKPKEEEAKDVQSVTVTCKRPSFAVSQRLMDLCVSQTGEINPFVFKNNLLYTLAVSWDKVDENGEAVACSIENLSNLRLEIAKDLSKKIEQTLGGIANILPI